MAPSPRRLLVRRIVGGAYVGTVLLLVGVLSAVWLLWRSPPSGDIRSRGANALWAAHRWVGDAHDEGEYAALARLVADHDLSDVFFHVGPLAADGTIPPERYTHAPDLVTAMERLAPGLRVQAYIGQVERRGGGPLDLDDADVRDRIAATAASFLDLGFDGIHYDIEPVYPDDERFLDLLRRTRAAMRGRGVLSVALEQVEVVSGAQRLVSKVVDRYHDPTASYLQRVAAEVDQVAIMTYDSALPTDWLFGSSMAWQTERVARLVGDRVQVFMGVPTYDYDNLGFHPKAENMRTGVRGVRKGVARLPERLAGRVGVAVYAEWTTSAREWAQYRRAWVG